MSSGGIFNLITNSGVQDKLLMATDYLNSRVSTLSNTTTNNISLDNSWIPAMNFIEKSHILFVHNTYRPYVASSFEYLKVNPNGLISFGNDIKFTLPTTSDFINDMCVHVTLDGLSALSDKDRVRYVSMLGHKLFKKTDFTVGSNILDTYYTEDYNAYYEFKVPPSKKTGWLRNMGQEIPLTGYVTADPINDFHREYKTYSNGNQTFKQKHDSVEMWIPLLFWFKDISCSFPNFAIPYGQNNVNINLASIDELVGVSSYGGNGLYNTPTITCDLYVNNIYIMPEIRNLFIDKIGFTLIRVHGRHVVKSLSNSSDSLLLNSLKWPTECLYLAFKPQTNLSLSQFWHKNTILEQTNVKVPVATKNSNSVTKIKLTNITQETLTTQASADIVYVSGPVISPLESYYNGYDLEITENTYGSSGYNSSDVIKNKYNIISYNSSGRITINKPWTYIPTINSTLDLYTPQLAINTMHFFTEKPTIKSISLSSSGIEIYKPINESFFNSYTTYQFGENNTPHDRGWYMLNFNFLPGSQQPSGHVNISNARELYLSYTSNNISDTNLVDLTVLSDCINFLVIKDGGAVLRFTT